MVYPLSPVLELQNWIAPESALSATRIVATSPTRRKQTQARVARAPRRGPYLDLVAFCMRMTGPAGGRYGWGPADAAPAAILL